MSGSSRLPSRFSQLTRGRVVGSEIRLSVVGCVGLCADLLIEAAWWRGRARDRPGHRIVGLVDPAGSRPVHHSGTHRRAKAGRHRGITERSHDADPLRWTWRPPFPCGFAGDRLRRAGGRSQSVLSCGSGVGGNSAFHSLKTASGAGRGLVVGQRFPDRPTQRRASRGRHGGGTRRAGLHRVCCRAHPAAACGTGSAARPGVRRTPEGLRPPYLRTASRGKGIPGRPARRCRGGSVRRGSCPVHTGPVPARVHSRSWPPTPRRAPPVPGRADCACPAAAQIQAAGVHRCRLHPQTRLRPHQAGPPVRPVQGATRSPSGS
jgi:hypothetical protein